MSKQTADRPPVEIIPTPDGRAVTLVVNGEVLATIYPGKRKPATDKRGG